MLILTSEAYQEFLILRQAEIKSKIIFLKNKYADQQKNYIVFQFFSKKQCHNVWSTEVAVVCYYPSCRNIVYPLIADDLDPILTRGEIWIVDFVWQSRSLSCLYQFLYWQNFLWWTTFSHYHIESLLHVLHKYDFDIHTKCLNLQ